MYGGLDTNKSNLPSQFTGAPVMVPSFRSVRHEIEIRLLSLSILAFCCAKAAATVSVSIAVASNFSSHNKLPQKKKKSINKNTIRWLFNRARLMAPVPQPISRELISVAWFTVEFESNSAEIIDTRSSVSGLGMKTGGDIFNVIPKKSHSSITYCTGILLSLRFIFFSITSLNS